MDDIDDDNCSPETKIERERVRRQANNARERFSLYFLLFTPRFTPKLVLLMYTNCVPH